MFLDSRKARLVFLVMTLWVPPLLLGLGIGLILRLGNEEEQYFLSLGLLSVEGIMNVTWLIVVAAAIVVNRRCRSSIMIWVCIPILLIYLVLLGGLGGHW